MTKDPVCGMAVTRSSLAGRSEYQGKAYYFCSPACKEVFDRDPTRYHIERLTGSR
jgi:YHS domain-containing protein